MDLSLPDFIYYGFSAAFVTQKSNLKCHVQNFRTYDKNHDAQ